MNVRTELTLLFAMAAAASQAAPAHAAVVPQVFERIADTTAEIDDIAFGGQLNDEGEVAFFADLDGGGEGIYRFHGGVLSPVATAPDAEFASLGIPDINDAGKLAFQFLPVAGGSGISIGVGPLVSTLYDTMQLTHNLHIFSQAMVNDDGRVAFVGHAANVPGVYLDNNGPPALLVDASGAFKSFSLQDFHNNARVLIFAEMDNGTQALYRLQPNAPAIKIADSSGPIDQLGMARMNADGVVAFTAIMDNGDFAIYTGSGGGLTPIADSTGEFEFTVLPQINDGGDIVFAARPLGGPAGIYSAASPESPLIQEGDELDGSTMMTLMILCDMNNRNQILFSCMLADGRLGMYLASPDADGDGTPDYRDGCPIDADKTAPGNCGCGSPEFDTDGDGTPDACEPAASSQDDGSSPADSDSPGQGPDAPVSGDCCGGGMPMMLPLLVAGLGHRRRRSRRA